MTAREDLRRQGAEMRHRLGLTDRTNSDLSPGLANLTDEMVYGRVWSRAGLELEERMLATLSALTCRQYLGQLSDFVGAALHIGMSVPLVQEVMLHCSMYAGIPTAVNSLKVVRAVVDSRGMPQPEFALNEVALDELMTTGQLTMRSLHADRSEGGYAAPDSAASGLYGTAIDFLYGEIWNRPGISHRQRMICSIAAFTAMQLEPQQRKFFHSALNVGLSRDEILEVIAQTGPYSGFPQAFNALAVAEEVLS